jgi:hypothetical protein
MGCDRDGQQDGIANGGSGNQTLRSFFTNVGRTPREVMNMSNWFRFSVSEKEESSSKSIRGRNTTVFTSPYDVPQHFRVFADKNRNEYIVEFKYIDDEPLRRRVFNHVDLWIGRNSCRLYRIGVSRGSINPDDPASRESFLQNVQQAIDRLQYDAPKAAAFHNYQVTKSGISDVRNTVYERLVGSSSG